MVPSDCHGPTSPSSSLEAAPPPVAVLSPRADDAGPTRRRHADPSPSRPVLARDRRPSASGLMAHPADRHLRHLESSQLQPPVDRRTAAGPVTNPPASASVDQIVTPPPSDTSAGLDGSALADASRVADDAAFDASSQDSLPRQPSAVQDAGSRKRRADGLVKARDDSASPVKKGHSRHASALSVASTTGSNVGQLSAELKTLLSYAMVKVHHGWQSRSLDEVEALASHAESPASSAYTVRRMHDASTSPRQPLASNASHVNPWPDSAGTRPESNSPPSLLSPLQPVLAAPAPIQPSVPPTSGLNARRSSHPRRTPTMLSRTPSASPHTPGPAPRSNARQPSISRAEQDVAESLLFMSSPGNSTNLKHAFSPSISPAAQPVPSRGTGTRHALPSGPRKALPSQRPALAVNKAGSMPPPPGSPMDLDSPQSTLSPTRGAPKRRVNGASSHVRASLSLPSGLGMVPANKRKSLRDEDIERMLDRAAAESPDSSDGEDIRLAPRRRGVGSVFET